MKSAETYIAYFAYGSNMDSEDIAYWCEKHNKNLIALPCAVPAVLHGYKLVFNHYSISRQGGAANIIVSPSDNVYGLLYMLNATDIEIIREKEGYSNIYDEIDDIEIETLDGKIVRNVLTYKLRANKEKQEHQPPTKYYLNLITRNARKYNFPNEYIKYLESIETKD